METKKEYHKTVKHGTTINHYYYIFDHSEPISSPRVKNSEGIPEYIRSSSKMRHIFIEDMSRRYTEVIAPMGKAGRPFGSKDSYQRTRRKKEN